MRLCPADGRGERPDAAPTPRLKQALPESYRRDRAWYGACLVGAHTGAAEAERAEAAVRFAADIAAVNSYARGQLLDAAAELDRIGAPQARVIRDALHDEQL